MEEIQLKYIEIYCADCYYFHGPKRVCDTANVILIIDLNELIMQRVPVQRATNFLRSIKNTGILRTPVQQATTFAQDKSICNIYSLVRTVENEN